MARVAALVLAANVRDFGRWLLLLDFQRRDQRVFRIDHDVARPVSASEADGILHGRIS